MAQSGFLMNQNFVFHLVIKVHEFGEFQKKHVI